MALAQWMDDGEPPFDLWEVDIRRVQPFQRNRRYLDRSGSPRRWACSTPIISPIARWRRRAAFAARRCTSGLQAARRLLRRGRRLGARQLVRRAEGGERRIPLHLEAAELVRVQRAEHMAVRDGVGLFDMTSFGKIRVEGRDAEARAAADLRQRCRRRAGPHRLHADAERARRHRGRPDGDAPLGDRLPGRNGAAPAPRATIAWLKRHIPDEAHCVVTDVTAGEAVLVVMGPKSRALLQPLDRHRPLQRGLPVRHGAGRSRSAWGSPARIASPMSASSAGSSTSPPIWRDMSSRRSAAPAPGMG